uniref:Uncharacterized protein n=1 Tax=Anguilla anguilla TaxID=7936 RepID=A0A0E9S822_ANGAN
MGKHTQIVLHCVECILVSISSHWLQATLSSYSDVLVKNVNFTTVLRTRNYQQVTESRRQLLINSC